MTRTIRDISNTVFESIHTQRSCHRIGILLILLFSFLAPLYAQKTFTMAFAFDPSQNSQYLFFKEIYTEAFKELGYNFQYKVYPSKRSTLMADEGTVDGEPQRIFEYGDKHSNLIRVDEHIFENKTLVFAIDRSIHIDSLSSLKETKFRVEYLSGSVWSKDHLQSLVPEKRLSSVPTVPQGFKKLELRRTDLFVALEVLSLEVLHSKEFAASSITPIAVVGSNLSFPYLHKSHRNLAPQLATVLRRMKKDGRYNQILRRTMPFISTQQ